MAGDIYLPLNLHTGLLTQLLLLLPVLLLPLAIAAGCWLLAAAAAGHNACRSSRMYVLSAADDSVVQLFASPALLCSADTHTHGQNELQGKQARCCSVEKASSSCDQQRRRLVIQPRWIAVMIAFIIPGSRAWGNGQERWELYPDFTRLSKASLFLPEHISSTSPRGRRRLSPPAADARHMGADHS